MILNEVHFCYLAELIDLYGIAPREMAYTVLKKANVKAYNIRYGENLRGSRKHFDPEWFCKEPYAEDMIYDHIQALKAVNCYEYQAIDDPDFYETDAGKMTRSVYTEICHAVNDDPDIPISTTHSGRDLVTYVAEAVRESNGYNGKHWCL
jgi:hypothetical protein